MKAEYKHFIIIILGVILIGGFLLSRNDKTIDIEGEIVEISNSNQDELRILVIGKVNSDKAYVAINPQTLIYRGDSSTRIASNELKLGDNVQVIFKDKVMECYTVQAIGDAVRIR